MSLERLLTDEAGSSGEENGFSSEEVDNAGLRLGSRLSLHRFLLGVYGCEIKNKLIENRSQIGVFSMRGYYWIQRSPVLIK